MYHVRFLRLLECATATPAVVHVMMVLSVSLYAIFGAVVIRKLESKEVTNSNVIMKRSTSDRSVQVRVINDTIAHSARNQIPADHYSRMDDAIRRRATKDAEERMPVSRLTTPSATVISNHGCVLNAIRNVLNEGDCSPEVLSRIIATEVDHCYSVIIETIGKSPHKLSRRSASDGEEQEETWSFVESILFCFTVITTIGYGNVTPETFAGRLFCILYGLIGIPITLLAIADVGKFISETVERWQKAFTNFKGKCVKKYYMRGKLVKGPKFAVHSRSNGGPRNKPFTDELADLEPRTDVENPVEDDESDSSDSETDEKTHQAVSLFLLFLLYITLGAIMITTYEPDMDFFKAIYFNFVTLTSIGLGDIVPRSETYMFFTITYIAIGLALTTIAIEIAADTLKRLHYFGRKIENVANVQIWFGGKKLTVKQLIRNLGDQFNLPATMIKNLDLDGFVDQAIKVEAGEIPSLRPPPIDDQVLQLNTTVDFADDEEEGMDTKPNTVTHITLRAHCISPTNRFGTDIPFRAGAKKRS
uniref:Potassium channel domain-containing protein n=1 Tax=Parascaris univalens TaxID=6257 RepID=A0A915B7N7_PARUN